MIKKIIGVFALFFASTLSTFATVDTLYKQDNSGDYIQIIHSVSSGMLLRYHKGSNNTNYDTNNVSGDLSNTLNFVRANQINQYYALYESSSAVWLLMRPTTGNTNNPCGQTSTTIGAMFDKIRNKWINYACLNSGTGVGYHSSNDGIYLSYSSYRFVYSNTTGYFTSAINITPPAGYVQNPAGGNLSITISDIFMSNWSRTQATPSIVTQGTYSQNGNIVSLTGFSGSQSGTIRFKIVNPNAVAPNSVITYTTPVNISANTQTDLILGDLPFNSLLTVSVEYTANSQTLNGTEYSAYIGTPYVSQGSYSLQTTNLSLNGVTTYANGQVRLKIQNPNATPPLASVFYSDYVSIVANTPLNISYSGLTLNTGYTVTVEFLYNGVTYSGDIYNFSTPQFVYTDSSFTSTDSGFIYHNFIPDSLFAGGSLFFVITKPDTTNVTTGFYGPDKYGFDTSIYVSYPYHDLVGDYSVVAKYFVGGHTYTVASYSYKVVIPELSESPTFGNNNTMKDFGFGFLLDFFNPLLPQTPDLSFSFPLPILTQGGQLSQTTIDGNLPIPNDNLGLVALEKDPVGAKFYTFLLFCVYLSVRLALYFFIFSIFVIFQKYLSVPLQLIFPHYKYQTGGNIVTSVTTISLYVASVFATYAVILGILTPIIPFFDIPKHYLIVFFSYLVVIFGNYDFFHSLNNNFFTGLAIVFPLYFAYWINKQYKFI